MASAQSLTDDDRLKQASRLQRAAKKLKLDIALNEPMASTYDFE